MVKGTDTNIKNQPPLTIAQKIRIPTLNLATKETSHQDCEKQLIPVDQRFKEHGKKTQPSSPTTSSEELLCSAFDALTVAPAIKIPTLNLSAKKELNQDYEKLLIPVDQRFKEYEERIQALKQQPTPNSSKEYLSFTLEAIDLAYTVLGLMQAITGNEHDSFTEKLWKEKIPAHIRNNILAQTKELSEQYMHLYSKYTELCNDTTINDSELHKNYSDQFLALADSFIEKARQMQNTAIESTKNKAIGPHI